MNSQARFLLLLWVFVIGNFVLYQNTTQDPVATHNDLCKQNSDLNQSRIMNINSVQSDLIAAWPNSASSDPRPALSAMSTTLLDANRQFYAACIAQTSVRGSQTLALNELIKLADPSSNSAWKNFVAVTEGALATLKAGVQ